MASGRWSDPLIPRRAHTHQGSSNGSRWARNGKVLMDCTPAAQQCIAASVDRGGQMNFRPLPFLAVPHTLERAQQNLPGSETSWCHSLSEQQSWSGWKVRRCGNQRLKTHRAAKTVQLFHIETFNNHERDISEMFPLLFNEQFCLQRIRKDLCIRPS